MDHWRKLIRNEDIEVFKEDSIPPQFNWHKPFSSVDLGPTFYTVSMVTATLKEEASTKKVSIAVNVFKNDNVNIDKPELIHKRLLCYKQPTGLTTNLYSIQCGIGLPLLHLTLRDVLDDLKDEIRVVRFFGSVLGPEPDPNRPEDR